MREAVEAARILEVPRLVSEQYPKGLGYTAPEVGLEDERRIEKTVFSAARADGFSLDARDQAIVCGIETHVCVSQTVHDLLGAGDRGSCARRRRWLAPRDRLRSRPRADGARGRGRGDGGGGIVRAARTCRHTAFKAVQKLIL